MILKRKAIREILVRLQTLGALSLVVLWLGILRTVPQDIPKEFP
jgi:hypothetical protein